MLRCHHRSFPAMNKTSLDLYTDYLLSTYGAAKATGLSAMVQAEVSHDQVTRFLSVRDYMSKDLWQQVKATMCSCPFARL